MWRHRKTLFSILPIANQWFTKRLTRFWYMRGSLKFPRRGLKSQNPTCEVNTMTMVIPHKPPSRTVLLRGIDFPDKIENTYGWIRENITKGNRSQMSPKGSNTQPDRRDLPRVLRVTRPSRTWVVHWKFSGKPNVPMTKVVGIMTTHWAKCETDGIDKSCDRHTN